ncbi:MAG: hypothetical protein GX621_16450, partial [Pirellulaceae bacterium]|nr:hypothetical protein [Pirellulaceae bacterium]
LFDPKPSTDGPTPLVWSLSIDFLDLPERLAPDFLYDALKQDVAAHPGHYLLVGDANGVIPIQRVVVMQSIGLDNIARATVTLVFFEPLPDDRFTLTVSDALVDPVGNALDGETNAVEPQEVPLFPTGDGVPGGEFVARFTVDSRPEIGVWAAGSVWIDTNGNFHFDPDNLDFTNRDIVYTLGYTSDNVFAGNFAGPGPDGIFGTLDDTAAAVGDAVADGFDKLAAYGRVSGVYRWLIDTDNDGVPNWDIVDPAGVNGLPFAGNFDGNVANGDEVGLFTGTVWWFDTNHDFLVDTSVASAIIGYPIVGDFDGDGRDDLATYRDDTFYFDLAFNGFGQLDDMITTAFAEVAGFIGVRERPVAADMDQDGIDDIGLWVPDRSGILPEDIGEWYFLISNDYVGENRTTGTVVTLDHRFTPIPFGKDVYARFGDEYAMPIVGNFDPPKPGGVGEATVARTAGLVATLVAAPTSTSGSGEVSVLPESEAWVDEWSGYWIEIWVDMTEAGGQTVADAVVDLHYNTVLVTATAIEYGPGFFRDQSGTIDDAAGVVDGLGAKASTAGLAGGGYVLLARVRFDVTDASQGVAVGSDSAVASVDCGIALSEGRVTYLQNGFAGTILADSPPTQVRPVQFDFDDNGTIGPGDLSYFAAAYGKAVGTPGVAYSLAADFDGNGVVGPGDLSYFAAMYGLSRPSVADLAYSEEAAVGWGEPDASEGLAESVAFLDEPDVLDDAIAVFDHAVAEEYGATIDETPLDRQRLTVWADALARRRVREDNANLKRTSLRAVDLVLADN